MSEFTAWKKTVGALSDEILLERTLTYSRDERHRTAWVVAHLSEVYRRDLALRRGFQSLYMYAREALTLSESQAWDRVAAARLALEVPETVERLASGELTLHSARAIWNTIRDHSKAQKPAAPSLQPELLKPPLVSTSPVALGSSDPTHFSNPSDGSTIPRTSGTPGQPRKPLDTAEKRELFTSLLGKTSRESEVTIQEWKQTRTGTPPAPKPKTTQIVFDFTDDELEKFNRLRDILSHKLRSRDRKAALL
jgi:hypothetical protein